jgi:pimeloyl-ACP methyl ester carboxylesterase
MWEATGWRMPRNDDPSDMAVFYHDVDPELAAEAMSKERRDAGGDEPWPLPAWPSVPTHFIVCRNDRFFAAGWLRGVVRDRLGIEPDEIESGHTPALSHPTELVDLMESYR